jgi:hypothetical protein
LCSKRCRLISPARIEDIETRRAVSPTPASSDGASASAKTRRSKGPFWTLSAAIGKIEVRHDMPSYPTISAATLPHSHSIVDCRLSIVS